MCVCNVYIALYCRLFHLLHIEELTQPDVMSTQPFL